VSMTAIVETLSFSSVKLLPVLCERSLALTPTTQSNAESLMRPRGDPFVEQCDERHSLLDPAKPWEVDFLVNSLWARMFATVFRASFRTC
jgi:hypothetical protein